MKNIDFKFDLICYLLLLAGVLVMSLGGIEYGIYLNTLVVALKVIPIARDVSEMKRENKDKTKD